MPPPDASDVDAALVAKLLADTGAGGILTLMPDGVFMDEAGASMATGGACTQFVIVSLVDAHDEPMFNARAFEDVLYLVKAVELSTVTVPHIKAAAARIDALLEQGTLTVAGYTLMLMRRDSRIRTTETDDVDRSIRWQHRGGRYQVVVSG